MSWLKNGCFYLSLLITLNGVGQGASETISSKEESPRVTILIFDFATLPEKIQDPMREKTGRIYQQAGALPLRAP